MTFLIILLWRIISVFVVQTAHVPDEYWQSLEVSHKMVFGFGHLTWEWNQGIRSYIYPLFISWIFKILKMLHLDYAMLLTTFPKIAQAILSAYAEYRFYHWTNKNKSALFSLSLNWYWYYCAPRTLINSVETALTMIALSIFPWKNGPTRGMKFLWIVGLLCAMRPTAVVLWLPLFLYHFCTTEMSKFLVVAKYGLIGLACLSLSTLIDSYYYGKWVITSWEFLRANVIHNVSAEYGSQASFWYLTSGLPVILGLQCLQLPSTFWQIFKHPKQYHKQAILSLVILWSLLVYSSLPHKEFRFILPLLPILIYLITSVRSPFHVSRKLLKVAWAVSCVSNVLPGLYFSLIHQRGSLDAMHVLRNELLKDSGKSEENQVLFLMPCHSTPLYSHLHVNVSVRFLTCEPNLERILGYEEEASEFFAEPEKWLQGTYKKEKLSFPRYLVVFEKVVGKMEKFFGEYQVISRIFYAHFWEGNYGGHILVCRKKSL